MPPFDPLFRNPHLQTIAGHFWKRPSENGRFPVERRLFRTAPEAQVLLLSQRPEASRGEIVLLHGLEGAADTGYMEGMAVAALRAGFGAHRLNMRTCGGTERLSQTLYHAGLTCDLLAVLRQLQGETSGPVFLVGFSLGGNVVLKLAGELGESARDLIAGVCTVSTPLDLEPCARRIAEPDYRVYERRFVRRMCKRLRATGLCNGWNFEGLRSVMDIDDRITAPSFGFGTAENYYRTQSAIRYLGAIRVPVMLLQAKDDTFVPFEIFESEAVASNPWIELVATEYGGHMGFLGRKPHRFWADEVVIDWIERHRKETA